MSDLSPPTARTFTAADIPFADQQTANEGWDGNVDLFEICLAYDPQGCFVADIGDQPVGMITTVRYERTAWIGNLIVLNAYRRRGVGRRLMETAVAHLEQVGVTTIRLEADPPGVALYRRLGFVDEFESLRFTASDPAIDNATKSTFPRARIMSPRDFADVTAFDLPCFGDDRHRLLELALGRAEAAYCVRVQGDVRGYVMVTPSRLGIRLAPWVATGRDVAESLLRAALRHQARRTVGVGVTASNRTAIALLQAHGFKQTEPSLRMRRGKAIGAGRPSAVFGLLNGAMG